MVKSQMDFDEKDITILDRIRKIFKIRGKQEAVKKSLELVQSHGILDKEEKRRRDIEHGQT